MRSKGEGSIYRRTSDNLWCATIELPPRDGQRRRKTITGKNKNDVIRKLNKARHELETHGDLPSAAQTVEQWLTYWLDNMAARENRPKTVAGYRSVIIGHIIPAIGTVRLDKLTPAHVRRMTDRMLEDGMSSTYALNAHRVLSSALTVAEREGRIPRNVAKLSPAPRKRTAELDVLTTAEAARLVSLFGDEQEEKYLWATFLLTGARRGEILGLEWDRVTDVLDLSWQLQRHKLNEPVPADYERRHLVGGLWLTRPKSRAGWRVIPLVDPLRSILERWQSVAGPNPYGLVFTASGGRPFDPDQATAAWPTVLKAAGIDKHVRIHDLRHTAVDIMYEAGVPEDLIVQIAGHSTRAMTRAYRSREQRTRLTAAMEQFSRQFQLGT